MTPDERALLGLASLVIALCLLVWLSVALIYP